MFLQERNPLDVLYDLSHVSVLLNLIVPLPALSATNLFFFLGSQDDREFINRSLQDSEKVQVHPPSQPLIRC